MSDLLPYRPHPLLRSGHLQTLMIGVLSGSRGGYNAKSHRVPLADGEALIVHEELLEPSHHHDASNASLPDNAPLAILIHGLGGDHTSPYLQRIATVLRQRGFRPWRVDLRGSGHGLDLAWRPAHAGCSEDLSAVVRQAHHLFPEAPLQIVGFSLSGNIMLKMLGEAASGDLSDTVPLQAVRSAMAIAPPVDLHACAANMDRLSRRIYTSYYLRMLDKQVELRQNRWEQWRAVQRLPRVRTIRQFDARYTAPLSGFRDTEHYYTSASSLPLLSSIVTPTTIVVDRHDPIVTFQSFSAAQLNPVSTKLIVTDFGGHMGYFGLGPDGKLLRWMEHFVVEKLSRLEPSPSRHCPSLRSKSLAV